VIKGNTREPSNLLEELLSGAVVAAAAGAALLSILWWIQYDPALWVQKRVPLSRGEIPSSNTLPRVDIKGQYASFDVPVPFLEGSWPRFRGEGFDNINVESVPLAGSWDGSGPSVLWSVQLGEGHAGAAVRNGRVYLLDYDEEEKADTLRCLSLVDGRELWRRWYRTGAKRNHGISRTVPAVSDRYVVTIGPRCHVLCVDAATGDFRWGLDLVRDFGTKEPLWFTAQHPIIDQGLAVIAPAGRVLMMAVDCETGRTVWETPNPRGWRMSHSSVVPMTVNGRRMYLYAALGGIVGVAADGPNAGEVLWETTEWNHSVVAPSPVVMEDGMFLMTSGYGVGSATFQVSERDSQYSVRLVKRFEKGHFASEQQTPIFYRGRLYTIMPKDGGSLRRQAVCMEPGGTMIYSSGKDSRFGLGPFMIADGRIFILNDDGNLTIARAHTDSFEPVSRTRVLEGRDAWAPLALAGGRMLLRDSKRMVCLDLRQETVSAGLAVQRGDRL